MHPLVENYGDCGLDEEIEAVKTRVVECGDGEFMGVCAGEKKDEVEGEWNR